MRYPVPSTEGRLISVVRCWGGERWLIGALEMRRKHPVSGPSRFVPACKPHGHGESGDGVTAIVRLALQWWIRGSFRKERLLKGTSTRGDAEQTYKHRARSAE